MSESLQNNLGKYYRKKRNPSPEKQISASVLGTFYPVTYMFIASLFRITRKLNPSRYSSKDEQRRALHYRYIMHYYLAVKKNVL